MAAPEPLTLYNCYFDNLNFSLSECASINLYEHI